MAETEWYWCLKDGRAEPADTACPPDRRLGPYPSKEAAENWKQTVDARNQAWDDADKEWEGEEP